MDDRIQRPSTPAGQHAYAAPMPGPAASERHPWNDEFHWTPPRGPFTTISDDQARSYDQFGYLVLEDAFDPDEVRAVDRALTPGTELVRDLLDQLPDGRLSVAGTDTQIVAPNQVGSAGVLADFVHHPVLSGLCHDLIGPDVRLYWEQAVYKQPHSAEPVLWHQDNGYTYVEPQAYLTCWVALTDATPENGCVSVIPGAHTLGTLRHRSTPIGEECWGDWDQALDVPVTAGSVVVFTSLTPHATRRNLTDQVRKAYIVQYIPDGAVARDGDPDAGPGTTRPLEDPVLHAPILRDGRPVRS